MDSVVFVQQLGWAGGRGENASQDVAMRSWDRNAGGVIPPLDGDINAGLSLDVLSLDDRQQPPLLFCDL
eukprot:1358679-Rhodomonas_salina.1